MQKMMVFLASDHAGYALKVELIKLVKALGHDAIDLGPSNTDRVDYPDFGAKLAQAMKDQANARGVLVCGSGIGISIAANRFSHIRAALCMDATMARLAREHNDANVIAFGERLMTIQTASEAVKIFMETDFQEGRHTARVKKLSAI